MEIIDNFLDKETFYKIQEDVFSPSFPWFYNKSKVTFEVNYDLLYDFQFVHTFFINHTINSQQFLTIAPIIEKINPSALIGAKANLTTRYKDIVEYQAHVDHHFSNAMTAVFYFNTNNGYTKFVETGEVVESIENRMVIFPSDTLHLGTTHTDSPTRSLLNINFYR